MKTSEVKAVSFKPTHKLFLCTGQLPQKIEGRRFIVGLDGEKIENKTDDAFWERIKHIRFPHSFVKEKV